jgi:hypothetical protein
MKLLTFKGFLKKYSKSLSNNNTENIKKLAVEVDEGNLRLREPLLLMSLLDNLSSKNFEKNQLYDEYKKLKNKYSNEESLISDIADENSSISNNYKKVYRSYLSVKNRFKRDDDTKLLMKRKIENLKQQKAISDYRINKDLKINPGNYNAFMKHNKTNKLSLDNTRKILDYLEKI